MKPAYIYGPDGVLVALRRPVGFARAVQVEEVESEAKALPAVTGTTTPSPEPWWSLSNQQPPVDREAQVIDVVAGTRPNLVKVAPILRTLKAARIVHRFIWTGQHHGALDLRDELGMPPPDVDLSDKLDRRAPSTFLDRIAALLVDEWARRWPTAVVVVGDVTSTLAAAIAAKAHHIPVAHVEAGLRSRDLAMPEERNRVVVDALSDLRLTSERAAHGVLVSEWDSQQAYARRAVSPPAIEFVGNVMIDSLCWAVGRVPPPLWCVGAGRRYALVTMHRPSNVDTDAAWRRTNDAVTAIRDEGIDVLWVVHPRAPAPRSQTDPGGLLRRPRGVLTVCSPLPYREMVALMRVATLVATDSGGVQEETTALGVPCLTLRENTERPITVDVGTNTVVGLDPDRIGAEVRRVLAGEGKRGAIPEGWDGHAAERIVHAIERRYLT